MYYDPFYFLKMLLVVIILCLFGGLWILATYPYYTILGLCILSVYNIRRQIRAKNETQNLS